MNPEKIIYDYTNADGHIVHRTIRYPEKKKEGKYTQRRPSFPGEIVGLKKAYLDETDGKWWINNLQGVETVIYHLPAIAQRPDETIVIVEGEKDADNGFKRGLLTTTNPGGSKGWKDHHATFLTGRRVVIVPDNDEPGRDRIPCLVSSLQDVGSQVSVLDWGKIWPECPEKGDLSDYLVANPHIEGEELLKRLEDAAIRHLSMEEVQVVTDAEPKKVAAIKNPDSVDVERLVCERPRQGCSLDTTARDIASYLASKGFYKWQKDEFCRVVGKDRDTFNAEQLVGQLNALIKWVEIDKKHQFVDAKGLCKSDALAIINSPSLLDALPRLTSISEVATWVKRKNGSIELLQKGHDAESGVLNVAQLDYDHDLHVDDALRIFEKITIGLPLDYLEPSTKNLIKARIVAMFLASYLHGFFLGERRMLIAMTANRNGCGKSGMLKVAATLVSTDFHTSTPNFENDDKALRALESILFTGYSLYVFDNMDCELSFGPLESCMTTGILEGSKLFEKKNQFVAVETQFFLSANNPKWGKGGDLERRTLLIPLRSAEGDLQKSALDPTHKLEEKDLESMRPHLLAACCSLVKHWISQGSPMGGFVEDSFEVYCRTLGGICEVAGIINPFSKLGIKNVNPNKADRQDLFDLLADSGEINGNLWTFEEIRSRAREEGFFDAILDATAPTDSKVARSEATSLSKALGFDGLGGDGLPLRFGDIEVTRTGRAPRSQDARRGMLYRIIRITRSNAVADKYSALPPLQRDIQSPGQ